jgi:hypothetical protein
MWNRKVTDQNEYSLCGMRLWRSCTNDTPFLSGGKPASRLIGRLFYSQEAVVSL